MKSLLTQTEVVKEDVAGSGEVPGKKHVFTTLDALRGVAAVCVIERHIAEHIFFFTLASSYLAVDFFFALSGFVLTHAYTERFRKGQTFFSFLKQRLIRLYPLYALGAAIGFVAQIPTLRHLRPDLPFVNAAMLYIGAFIMNLCIIPTTFVGVQDIFRIFPFNPPSWSLMLEVVINIAFKTVYARLNSIMLVGAVIVAGIIFAICAKVAGTADVGWSIENFGGGFARVAFSFPLGILIYQVWQRWKMPVRVHPLVYAFILVAALAADPPKAFTPVYDALAIAVIFPLIIVGAAESTTQNRPLREMSLALGRISYAVYILHFSMFLLLDYLLQPVKHLHHRAHSSALITLGYTIAIPLLCVAIDKYYDMPIRAFLTARFMSKSITAAAPRTVKGL